ncbi:hypothetical protein [Nonomuraea zeae]|uniref:hypothetical protein n=1 Tax=Nonomuraea zeae TaxID=1642303 RepID=UPI00147970A8|nr:hypothetical protein [Nonomuraea zeae]
MLHHATAGAFWTTCAVRLLDCIAGLGVVVLDPASPTGLSCRYGTYNGGPVGGV